MQKNTRTLKIRTHFVNTESARELKKEKLGELSFFEERILRLLEHRELGENVYTQNSFFSELFESKITESSEEKRLIKITNPKTKKSIYRIWNGISQDKFGFGIETKGIIYMDSESKYILTGSSSESDESLRLQFNKVGTLRYFLHSRNKFNKESYAIALISVFLGLVSVILAIVPNLLQNFLR